MMFDMLESLSATRAEMSKVDQIVIAIAALLPVAWLPVFSSNASPRFALVLGLLPIGALALARQARGGSLPSRLGLLVCSSAVISAVLSPAISNSLTGSSEFWFGAAPLIASIGCWALAREFGPTAQAALPVVLTAGAILNVVIALAQVIFSVEGGDLATFSGRGAGLMSNPVHFGSFIAGVTAYWLANRSGTRRWALVIFTLSLGLGSTGSRVAVASAGLIAVWALVSRRNRRAALLGLTSFLAGLVTAQIIVSVISVQSSIAARAKAGGGLSVRWDIWRVAITAVRDRPIFGWGPGNSEIAVERHFTLAYVQDQLASKESLLRWTDPHNAVIHILIGMGIVGLVAVIAFVSTACVGVRSSSLMAATVAIGATWMVEPLTVHSMPVAMLMFGAAAAGSAPPSPQPVSRAAEFFEGHTSSLPEPGTSGILMLVVGAIAASAILASTFAVGFGLRYNNLELARVAATFGYHDWSIDDQITVAYVQRADAADGKRQERLQRAEWFARRSAREYPTDYTWSRVAEVEVVRHDLDAASVAGLKALSYQPFSPHSQQLLLIIADARHDQLEIQKRTAFMCAAYRDTTSPECSS